MTIQSNRSLGGYGACLVALSVISTVISFFQDFLPKSLGVSLVLSGISGIIGLLAVVGIILLLLAMSGFSREYKEPRIMNYIWTAIIIIIIGVVIIFAIAFVFLLSNIFSIIPNMSSTSTSSTQIASLTTRWLAPFLPIAGLVGLISILYVMRSLNLLADKSEVSLFRVAGKVLLSSAALTIVIGIIFAVISEFVSSSYTSIALIGIPSGFVQEVAWILLAMAYFRIKPPATSTQPFQQLPSGDLAVSEQVKYCPHCGSQNSAQSIYCTHCGQKL